MIKKIISFISNMRTIHLVLLPLAISIVPLSILLLIDSGHFSGKTIEGFLITLIVFIWGFTGLPMIIRKELPWLITIRGWPAVAEGIVIMLCSWIFVIVILANILGGK